MNGAGTNPQPQPGIVLLVIGGVILYTTGQVIRFVYNVVFHILFALSAPFYFLKMWRRGNWRSGFGERFARYDARFKQAITNRDIIWLHAVSVGEVNICTQLIKAIEARAPNLKIVVSTTTACRRSRRRTRTRRPSPRSPA